MKAVFFTLFALATSAIASPIIEERQLETQGSQLDSLMAKVQGYTAQINKTIDETPANANLLEQNAVAAKIAPQLQGITEALTVATTVLSKRETWTAQGSCDKECILVKIRGLLHEIVGCIKKILVKLGLGCVLVYLSPLIVAIVGLLRCLDKVVAGLLLAVKNIVNDLLKGLGIALLDLLL